MRADDEKVEIGRELRERRDRIAGAPYDTDRRGNRPGDLREPPLDYSPPAGVDHVSVELTGIRGRVVDVHDLDTQCPAAVRNREGASGFNRRVGGLAAVVAHGDARESGAGPPRWWDREHGATACEDAAGGDSRITDRHDDDVGIALFDTPGDPLGHCALAGPYAGDLEPHGLARGELLGGSAQAPAH